MTREELKSWIRGNLFNKNGVLVAARLHLKEQELKEYTPFLPEDVRLTERVYRIVHDMVEDPKCYCGKKTRYVGFTLGYSKCCSQKCASNSPEVRGKYENTCMNKYGHKNAHQAKSVVEKTKQTNIEIYGTENPMQCERVKSKAKATLERVYGVTNISQIEAVKEKKIQTCLTNNGVENPSQSPEIQAKKKVTWLEIYGTESPWQAESVKAQIRQTSMEIYGTDNPAKSEIVKERTRQSNLDVYGRECHTQCHITNEAMETLGSKEKLEELYKDKTVDETSVILGVHSFTLIHYMKGHGIHRRYEGFRPKAEMEIMDFVGAEIGHMHERGIITPQELDIYIPEYKLGIEHNGAYWHSLYDKDYHLGKTNACEAQGVQVLHVFEDEWRDPVKRSIWEGLINGKIDRNQLIETNDVRPVEDTREFLENNHLEGYIESKVNYGLFCDDELVSLACFSGARLWRYCNKVGFNVSGSLEMLLSRYGRDVIYLANRRWNYFPGLESTEPNEYISLGFKNWDCGDWIYEWRTE